MTTSEINLRRFGPERRTLATTHRFAEGQAVRFRNTLMKSGNIYLITASLPPLGASPQYRIRNEGEKFERMAMEIDLELASPPSANQSRTDAERLFEGRELKMAG
jgi:hypothetical protein